MVQLQYAGNLYSTIVQQNGRIPVHRHAVHRHAAWYTGMRPPAVQISTLQHLHYCNTGTGVIKNLPVHISLISAAMACTGALDFASDDSPSVGTDDNDNDIDADDAASASSSLAALHKVWKRSQS